MSSSATTRKWHHHSVVRVPKRVLSSLMLLVAFVVPIYLFVTAGQKPERHRISFRHHTPPPVQVPAIVSGMPLLVWQHEMNGHWWYARLLPKTSLLWRDYRVRVNVTGLGAENSGTSAALGLSNGAYAVTVSAGRLRITEGHKRLVYVRVPVKTHHQLDVSIEPDKLHVNVDRKHWAVPSNPDAMGGISFGFWLAKPLSPIPDFENLSVEPQ